MSWQNGATQVPQSTDKASFPFIQWVNDGSKLEPREPRGGFAMPDEQMQLAGDFPLDARMHGFYLKNNEQLQVAFTTAIRAAVLATRFAWIKDENFVPGYVPGARSKLQALCLVQGLEKSLLVVLTFAGMTGKSFSDAWKKHKERVQKATAKAGQKAPATIFYAVYNAGQPRLEGQGEKSWITPVVLDESADFDLDAAYVGDDALALVDWTLVEDWRKAWDNPKGPNGEGEISETEEAPAKARPAASTPAPAAAPARPAPATTGQYSASLPFKSTRYPNGTIQTLLDARDEAALKGTVDWCNSHNAGETPACTQAVAALKALKAVQPAPAPEEDSIPF